MKNFVNNIKLQLLFILLAGFCLQVKAQWNMIAYSNDSSSCGWEDVFFMNKDTGFVVGCLWPAPYTHPPAVILRTHNGGLTWDTTLFINTNIEPHLIMSIHCPNDSVCYAGGSKSRLYKTTDGGNTWTWSSINAIGYMGNPPAVMNDVYFMNNDTGFICHANMAGSLVARTTDGGISWVTDSVCSGALSFSFPNNTIGYNSTGCKTTNGGNTWGFVNTLPHINHPQLNSYKATSFIDSLWGFIAAIGSKGFDYGYDVYNFGVIARTKDGGDLWDCKDYPNIRFVNTIQMLNKNEGYFGGTPNFHLRYIFKTENGGDNWYPQELIGKNIYNYYPDIFSIHCPTDSVCYAVGRYQYIYKTTNAGGPLIGVGINENKVQTNGLRVYPNPANTEVFVAWDNNLQGNITINICDISGKIVNTTSVMQGTKQTVLDVAGLTSGMYFIKLNSHDTNYVEKLLIQK